jgi:hypothetical protein
MAASIAGQRQSGCPKQSPSLDLSRGMTVLDFGFLHAIKRSADGTRLAEILGLRIHSKTDVSTTHRKGFG